MRHCAPVHNASSCWTANLKRLNSHHFSLLSSSQTEGPTFDNSNMRGHASAKESEDLASANSPLRKYSVQDRTVLQRPICIMVAISVPRTKSSVAPPRLKLWELHSVPQPRAEQALRNQRVSLLNEILKRRSCCCGARHLRKCAIQACTLEFLRTTRSSTPRLVRPSESTRFSCVSVTVRAVSFKASLALSKPVMQSRTAPATSC